MLPHNFFYLSSDNAGLTQVFRMERDGKTVTQLTFESANVTDYDVSPADGSIVYVADHQLILVNSNGSNRHVLVDGAGYPVFSPDGRTLSYARNGLNLYDLSTGIPSLVLEDIPLGGTLPPEIYAPENIHPMGRNFS